MIQQAYFDWNASAPIRSAARAAVVAALDATGNPSSVHGAGRASRALIEAARANVANLVKAQPTEVIFTSGATEANATIMRAGWDVIAHAGIEHDSIIAPAAASGARVVALPVTVQGVVDLNALREVLAQSGAAPGRGLFAIQSANNETGARQPVAEIARIAREFGFLVHCDAVQSAGRDAVDFGALGVDAMAISGHKLGGPKGVGALIVRNESIFKPMLVGGGQERRRRGGTENVSGIAGFGAAAEAARRDVEAGVWVRVAKLRDHMERELLALTPGAVIISAGASRLANTTLIALPGRSSDALVAAFDLAGVALSAGAACSSGRVGPSHVLAAMHIPPDLARAALRISIGPTTNEQDLAVLMAAWNSISQRTARAA